MSGLLDEYANDWTAETGFSSESLKNDKYGTPRAVIGKEALKMSLYSQRAK